MDLHPDFAAGYDAPMAGPGAVTVLVDRCSVEVFAPEVALSALVFPAATSDRLSVYGQVLRVTLSRPAATSDPPGRITPMSDDESRA